MSATEPAARRSILERLGRLVESAEQQLALAAIEIELCALDATIDRCEPTHPALESIPIKLNDIDCQLAELVADMLGYFGLVADRPGVNERPVDSSEARWLRQLLATLPAGDAVELMRRRDRIYQQLASR